MIHPSFLPLKTLGGNKEISEVTGDLGHGTKAWEAFDGNYNYLTRAS